VTVVGAGSPRSSRRAPAPTSGCEGRPWRPVTTLGAVGPLHSVWGAPFPGEPETTADCSTSSSRSLPQRRRGRADPRFFTQQAPQCEEVLREVRTGASGCWHPANFLARSFVALEDGYDLDVIGAPAPRKRSSSGCWRTPGSWRRLAHDQLGPGQCRTAPTVREGRRRRPAARDLPRRPGEAGRNRLGPMTVSVAVPHLTVPPTAVPM